MMLLRRIKLIVVTAIVTVVALALLSGCNTARGFGKDVRAVGGAISRAAK